MNLNSYISSAVALVIVRKQEISPTDTDYLNRKSKSSNVLLATEEVYFHFQTPEHRYICTNLPGNKIQPLLHLAN